MSDVQSIHMDVFFTLYKSNTFLTIFALLTINRANERVYLNSVQADKQKEKERETEKERKK